MKIRTLTDKITAAIIYMLVVEIAVSFALAINFMYDYHFFDSDGISYPIQKAMNIKTAKEFDKINDYISLYLSRENGIALTEREEAEFEALADEYSPENTNIAFSVFDETGRLIMCYEQQSENYCFSKQKSFSVPVGNTGTASGTVRLSVKAGNSIAVQDGYSLALKLIGFAHTVRYAVFFLLFVLMCAATYLLGSLMSSIGNDISAESKNKHLNYIDRIPFDLLTALVTAFIAFALLLMLLTSAADIKEDSIVLWNAVILILTFFISFVILVYCLTLATRIKIGHIFQNTVIFKTISKIRKKRNAENEGYFKVPMLGKALISIGVVMLAELATLFYFVYKYKTCLSGRLEDFKFLYFAFAQVSVILILGALFFMIVLNLNSVRESGKKIISGDFDGVADSHIMFGDFKAINDDLITIKDDMIKALEEKNKSQEMRSELITNISHDIKTPLTSIVNYADIISSGKCSPDELQSYSEIIRKQSSKLSDLLFNLIEVSKISAGMLKVEFDEVNVDLFLSQTLEEFSPKFSEKNLTLDKTSDGDDIYISADGMILWRVFENLFGNIVKYAMPDTRIILNVERSDGKVIITLKNISENPISSTADELTARFKRDDNSRHTKGNGLGLSIAKSFTEVQNGKFEIFVDGDLFKTVITFDEYIPA